MGNVACRVRCNNQVKSWPLIKVMSNKYPTQKPFNYTETNLITLPFYLITPIWALWKLNLVAMPTWAFAFVWLGYSVLMVLTALYYQKSQSTLFLHLPYLTIKEPRTIINVVRGVSGEQDDLYQTHTDITNQNQMKNDWNMWKYTIYFRFKNHISLKEMRITLYCDGGGSRKVRAWGKRYAADGIDFEFLSAI